MNFLPNLAEPNNLSKQPRKTSAFLAAPVRQVLDVRSTHVNAVTRLFRIRHQTRSFPGFQPDLSPRSRQCHPWCHAKRLATRHARNAWQSNCLIRNTDPAVAAQPGHLHQQAIDTDASTSKAGLCPDPPGGGPPGPALLKESRSRGAAPGGV